ncbi:hypothetical protein ACWT_3593 [Actinoplanes sp. SE50]|uniref:DUF6928 family protein n=1 Tax=unclassified Actinoplanes TaxID=2626549 RepID=UPI00023EC2A8|nr:MULTISPECIES: hypothetical protein [unclassified Actinoplanes]AEV84616.1 hypothetical protein ACPL_3721 [Actinoplanes sp. SE50/110]ATO83008.1 hypothetical protein ACWT_3593 [Actinoplanes sp. SE50]SLM00416.1 hypothetical protein ACSP50_3648 [Actinoplanes sp. SE50/110]
MGAKTALLAFTTGDLRPALREAVDADPAEALALVRGFHPDYDVTPIGDGVLGEDVYPPDDTSYATVLVGAELLCDRRLVGDRPSQLPARLLQAGAGRRIIMHGMHSVSDWLCFAVWENGSLVRSLSLSPDGGIVENIGEPYDFERPYWAGERPAGATFTGDPYPLPFHPLELGEDALRALFGFILEGLRDPSDVDPYEVPLRGFRVADPTGREQAEREATMERLLRQMGPPRRFRMKPDGTFEEIRDAEA